ncbi:MAG TPA: formimidoylglutamate deiminase [Steroidobacteraceae bacterium]|jgi:formiminoglutamate deiminase|nr:formimidoylglutamate deiminase [Steroidobacteraceae bacterium]
MNLPAESRAIHCARALLPDGWARDVRLRIDGGKFAAVDRGAPAQPADERVAVAVPGLANVHSHGFQRGMAGLTEYRGPEADNFWSWRELMYRFVARMTPDDVEAITAQAYVEMLEGGFTRVGEFHYVHHEPDGKPYANPAEMAVRIGAAARTAGIALTLLPVFYAHGNFGGVPPTAGQRRFVTGLDQYARLIEASAAVVARLPDARLGVAPHSLRAVSPDELQRVVALVPGAPVHIHAAEQVREVEECVAWSGARPVEWLLDHADVNSRWCLVHATHMTDAEIAPLARSGAVAGFCPVTEANLGDGIAPAAAFMRAGGTVGIGTDSNVRISVSEELRQLEYSQRLRDRARNVLAEQSAHSTGRTLFAASHRGGERALGAGSAATGLSEGASADCVALEATEPGGQDDVWLDRFVFADVGIRHVWRAGRRWVAEGRHVARDTVQAGYRAALGRLLG